MIMKQLWRDFVARPSSRPHLDIQGLRRKNVPRISPPVQGLWDRSPLIHAPAGPLARERRLEDGVNLGEPSSRHVVQDRNMLILRNDRNPEQI